MKSFWVLQLPDGDYWRDTNVYFRTKDQVRTFAMQMRTPIYSIAKRRMPKGYEWMDVPTSYGDKRGSLVRSTRAARTFKFMKKGEPHRFRRE